MRLSLLLLVSALLSSSCIFVVHDGSFGDHAIHGSGDRIEVERSVPAFHGVTFEAAGEVHVTVGGPTSVVLSGDDNLLEGVTTEVRGGHLTIHCPDEYDFDEELEVTIRTPELGAFQLNGAGEVTLEGIRGSVFELGVSGAGEIVAGGAVERLHVSVSGACEAELRELSARDVHVSISGAGEIELSASDSLRYEISGAGEIEFSGNPRVSGSVSGAGEINRR